MKAIVYTTPTSASCHDLIFWMKQKGIDFEERNIADPVKEVESWRTRVDGINVVPTTLIGSRKIEGVDHIGILQALGRTA